VVEVLPPVGGVNRYRVFHTPAEVRDYREDQLRAITTTPPADALGEAIAAGRWLDGDLFRARLTAQRLSHPLINNLYAFQAARIQFIPFQLKPLLRFLRADQPRLLVADEVGVGKTIEAGLILKELQTRQRVDNVLIVCPKALVSKWRMEMRRFDEDFRPLTSETLRYCLREAHMDGAWPSQYSRAICHLELLRVEEIMAGTTGRHPQPGLLTLNPPPQFTLAVFDEAHHLRNPGTRSHELARYVCDVSEAVLFLSATPLHLGSENLFTLLNLLRPDVFPDATVFAEMSEPNQHLTQAMRHVRTRLPEDSWQHAAADALAAAAATSWGRQVVSQDPSFSVWQDRLGGGAVNDDTGRVRCPRELEELHTLAHVMNRTRRRDIGAFTLREAHTIQVDFTPPQRELYDALLDFRMRMLLLQLDPRVASLVMDTLERQAASCLHALVPTLAGFIRRGRFSGCSDDPELDDVQPDLPPLLAAKAEDLRQLAQQLPADDPKLERLREIVRETLATPGPGKVLVFSYFLHTLDYLRQHLQAAGARVEVVNGRLPDEEREHLRDRFRLPREDPDALDVLLSSEVGCEGLDYQFCDRLVNYDIPWNPMRIEQRIGRIDRYGQASPKVLIFNFITPGTVEGTRGARAGRSAGRLLPH
jgi:SNF2 family DNA or RNA helicase